MRGNLTLPWSHKQYFVRGFQKRLDEIGDLLQTLENEKSELLIAQQQLLAKMQSNDEVEIRFEDDPAFTLAKPDSYPKDGFWLEKGCYILKIAERPLTTKEILDGIMEIEPELKRLSAIKSLSSVLNVYADNNKVVNRIVRVGKYPQYELI